MENQNLPTNAPVTNTLSLPLVPTPPRPAFRITSTTYLDWPQLGFALHSNESGATNDFGSLDEIPAEVRPKLNGFIRSGHVRFYDMSQNPPVEVTPKVAPLNADGTAPDSDETSDPLSKNADAPLHGRPNPNAPVPQELGSDVSNSGTPGGDQHTGVLPVEGQASSQPDKP